MIGILAVIKDEQIPSKVREEPFPNLKAEAFHVLFGTDALDILKYWYLARAESERAAAPVSRDQNGRCVLTGRSTVDDWPIVPLRLPAAPSKTEAFWYKLQIFWPLDDVIWLEERVKRNPGSLKYNMLPLGRDAQRMWNEAQFALRPLPSESLGNDKMELQFCWVKSLHSPTKILSLERLDWPLNREDGLVDRSRRERIKSGDTVHLQSPDIVRCPLPDRRLLRWQWDLNLALCGSGLTEFMLSDFVADEDDGPEDFSGEIEDAGKCPCCALLSDRDSGYGTESDEDDGGENGASGDDSGELLEWLFDDVNGADESNYEHLHDKPEFANYLIDCAVRRGIIPREDRYWWMVRLHVVPPPDVSDANGEHG